MIVIKINGKCSMKILDEIPNGFLILENFIYT